MKLFRQIIVFPFEMVLMALVGVMLITNILANLVGALCRFIAGDGEEAVQNSKDETLWCSPHCVPERVTGTLDLFAA